MAQGIADRFAHDREAVTVSASRNGGPWTTESVTRKDFLGRAVITERAGYGGSMLVTSNAFDAAGRLVFTQNHDGSAVAYAYDALGGSAGTVRNMRMAQASWKRPMP